MRFQKISLALLLVAVPATLVEGAWEWGSAENLCGGIEIPCYDKHSCTRVAVGPCVGSETQKPGAYLMSEITGVGTLNIDRYLSCGDDPNCEHVTMTTFTGPGFRDNKAGMTTPGGGEYAYTMTGNVYGDTNTEGGYVGTASYLVTGNTTIKSNYNLLYAANTGDGRVDRSNGLYPQSTSNIGAPNGPFKICISDINNGVCNGPERVFPPSAYKFSLFGSYFGSGDFSQYTNKGQNHYGFRAKMTINGFDVSTLKVNGRSYDENKVNDEVTSIEIGNIGKDERLHFEFPKKYNLGSTVGAVADGVTMATVIETKDMSIRVSGLGKDASNNGADIFFIDYIFKIEGIQNNRYFIYDPDVTAITGAAFGESSSVGTATSTIVLVVLLIVTMLLYSPER